MSAAVRPILEEEIGAWTRSVSIPFLDPANTAEIAARWDHWWRPQVEMGRTWAAEEHGRLVANAAVLSRTVTLPAAPSELCPVVPFAAVTAVGVHPTHRRRGLLRRLMAAMIDDARSRGEIIAGLTASEASIYGRFGFGPATRAASYRIATRESAFAVPAPTVDMELLDPQDAAKVLPGLFAAAIAGQPGQVDRTEAVWADIIEDPPDDRNGASARSHVCCPGGYAAFRTEEVKDPHDSWGRAHLREVVADSPEIEAALWRFVLDLDLVREVVAVARPVDEPLRARLVDPRQLHTTSVTDVLWLRVLDTPAALTARGYLRGGRLVLDVRAPAANPTGPDATDGPDPAAGRWTLDVGPDGSTCRAAAPGESTDLVVGMAELGSLLAGDTRASILAAGGRVEEGTVGALDRADALFASRPAPLTITGF